MIKENENMHVRNVYPMKIIHFFNTFTNLTSKTLEPVFFHE